MEKDDSHSNDDSAPAARTPSSSPFATRRFPPPPPPGTICINLDDDDDDEDTVDTHHKRPREDADDTVRQPSPAKRQRTLEQRIVKLEAILDNPRFVNGDDFRRFVRDTEHNVDKLRRRITELEDTVATLEDTVATLDNRADRTEEFVGTLAVQLEKSTTRLDDHLYTHMEDQYEHRRGKKH